MRGAWTKVSVFSVTVVLSSRISRPWFRSSWLEEDIELGQRRQQALGKLQAWVSSIQVIVEGQESSLQPSTANSPRVLSINHIQAYLDEQVPGDLGSLGGGVSLTYTSLTESRSSAALTELSRYLNTAASEDGVPDDPPKRPACVHSVHPCQSTPSHIGGAL